MAASWGPLHKTDTCSVAEFYTNRSIFITGATGFLGKVLLEKLLRSCPSLETVYVLIRPKSGRTAEERLQDLLQKKVFGRLRQEFPDFEGKLVALSGDSSKPNLGLSPQDLQTLGGVSVVFHTAATIKFNEPLGVSIATNLMGTEHVIKLCRGLTDLVALVHVSTAYCNSYREQVIAEEVHCSTDVRSQNLIDLCSWVDDKLLSTMSSSLVKGHPNTYTYTKLKAEQLLLEASSELPVAIIRPSIVTSSWKEPFPGWIDSPSGANGVIAMAGKGMLRGLFANWKYRLDIIPVDINANTMIAAAWYIALQRQEQPLVVHCASGSLNPLVLSVAFKHVNANIVQYPLNSTVLYPRLVQVHSRTVNKIYWLLSQYIPAAFLDLVLLLKGDKPKMKNMQEKVNRMIEDHEYFLTNQWTFVSENILKINAALSPEDKENFYLDIRSLDWGSYFHDFQLGLKQFLFKENLSTIPSAKSHIYRLRVAEKLLSLGLVLFILHILSKRWTVFGRLIGFLIRVFHLIKRRL